MNSVISVDTTELLKLATDLSNAAEIFGKGSAEAINRVAAQARKDTVLKITSQLKLGNSEVDATVVLIQTATTSKPQAVIEIVDEVHFLSSYGGQQLTKPNKTKRKARGDVLRGISAGTKAAGISAHVSTAGSRRDFRHVFTMPVLSGKAMKGRIGSFTRPAGGGKPRAVYGPSEYQAAKGVWRDMEKELTDNLETEVITETTKEIDKALKTK